MATMILTQEQQAQWNRKVEEETRLQREEEVRKFQRDSFPVDPVLLYEMSVTSVDGRVDVVYAVPNDDIENPLVSQKLVFFDVIRGDGVCEESFVDCSIVVRKVVFGGIADIKDTTLMVFDREMNAQRASKVLLGLLGIAQNKRRLP